MANWFQELKGWTKGTTASAESSVAKSTGQWRAQGNAALAKGELEESERCYREALKAAPGEPQALICLAFVLLEDSRPVEAEKCLRDALPSSRRGDGFNHEIHFLLARALRAQSQVDAALTSYDAALAAMPAFSQALEEKARLLDEAGRHVEALEAARRWSESGDSTVAEVLVANQLYLLGQYEQALGTLDLVIAAEPANSQAIAACGHVFIKLGRPEEAVVAFSRALAIAGKSADLLAGLGGALQRAGRSTDAQAALDQALELNPEHSAALCNSVHVLTEQLRLGDAISVANRVIAANPVDADMHWNLGIALLLQGQMEKGWREYEWRWMRGVESPQLPDPRRPRWTGEPLEGRTILLFAEQGFGDSIQFLRYVPQVRALPARVVLRLPPGLLGLAGRVTEGCMVLRDGDPLSEFDVQSSLMSLPGLVGTDRASVLGEVPYLEADTGRVQAWRERLESLAGSRLKVGIAWSGNPSHANDRNRSIPLAMFARLALPQCAFVSLQPQVRESDRAALSAWPDLLDFGPELTDFAETAALMQALDLVITVDTSVAHLAGALARPVWTLLPRCPDWRWMLGRKDSPWYPTMRLYRQESVSDWRAVIVAVRDDLKSRL